MKKILILLVVLCLVLTTNAIAQTIDLNQDGGDNNTYMGTHDYLADGVNVNFTYEPQECQALTGTIRAQGLKPGFTYQVKIEGKPTCLDPSGDDALNEYIGYHGRWTCADCDASALSKNRNDAEYAANKAKDDNDPTKECIKGYLVFDYFTTDDNGMATKDVVMDSSYHVLRCNGGTCGLVSDSLLVNGLCAEADVEGELQRFTCGGLQLDPGSYDVILAITEESFHQGAWANVLQNDNFQFSLKDCTQDEEQCETTLLDSVDIGNPANESGHLDMLDDGWSYVGDSVHDGGSYLKHGGYGGYDGGSADFRGLMGPPTGCDDPNATFMMDAGAGQATEISIRHLDGSANDAFDLYVLDNDEWVFIAHYTQQTTSEDWFTTNFDLPHPMSGNIEFKMVSTDPAAGYCSIGWGQVMVNWIKLYGCKGAENIPEFSVLGALLATIMIAIFVMKRRRL